jgi:biotin transport system substrate-specific component
VCALLPAIKVAGPVPITLQTCGVLRSGAGLGMRRGFLAVLLYVVAGAAGPPIFSGGAAGLAVLTGPTAGYLVGFPLAAGLCGAIVERLPRRSLVSPVAIFCAGLFSSAICIHTLGMAGLVLRADLTWAQAWDIDKIFWIGDVLKNVAMALVATAVHRAFPGILDRQAAPAPAGQGQPEGTPTA